MPELKDQQHEDQLNAAKRYLQSMTGEPLPEMSPEFAISAAESLANLMAQEAC